MVSAGLVDKEQPVFSIASTGAVACGADDSLKSVVDVMTQETSFRRLPVVGKDNRLQGVVGHLDVLNHLDTWRRNRRIKTFDVKARTLMAKSPLTLEKADKVSRALELFERGVGGFPVVQKGRLVGMLSEWDMIKQVARPMGVTVGQLMSRAATAKENWPVQDIVRIMCRGAFRRLPVAERGILTGIITPYDVLEYLGRRNRLGNLAAEKACVADIMKRKVATAEPDWDAYEAVEAMKSGRHGGLPVVEDHELVGIITERDIVRALL
jgi:CBS domain-containing protein